MGGLHCQIATRSGSGRGDPIRVHASSSALTAFDTGLLQGWEAIGRLRCSQGLEVETYMGGLYRRSTTDVEFAAVHADHALAVRVRHAGTLRQGEECHLQFALLFSSPDGQRRMRCAA